MRVAAAHVEPVWMSRDATIEQVTLCIAEAGDQDVRLLVMPESFVPGFPYWINLGCAPSLQQQLWLRLREEAIETDAPAGARALGLVRAAAKQHGVAVMLGATERFRDTLYNVQIMIDADGSVVGLRRKLVPTLFERTVWAAGDGSGLRTFDATVGRVAGLMCWEHLHHLIRHAVVGERPDVLGSAWPGFLPSLGIDGGFTGRAALLSASLALMGQVPVVAASHPVTGRTTAPVAAAIGRDLDTSKDAATNANVTSIFDARGEVIARSDAVTDELVVADLDLTQAAGARWVSDPVGHSSRSEVLSLEIDRRATAGPSPTFVDQEESE